MFYIKILSRRVCISVLSNGFHTTRSVLSCKVNTFTQVSEKNGVKEIRLSEPKSLNSLSMNMMNSLHEELLRDKDSPSLRCITLAAEGKVWSAGHNLKDLKESTPAEQAAIFSKLSEIIFCMRKLPVPVIAKVNGLVAAGGLQLVTSCDIVVCSDQSRFTLPAAKYGIFPHTPIVALTRAVPRLHATLIPFTGIPVDAKEAYATGLVSKVVSESELDAEVNKITAAITEKSRSVVALGKQFFYEQLDMPLEKAYEVAVQKMVHNMAMPDGQEGVNSFIEKRPPKWSHK